MTYQILTVRREECTAVVGIPDVDTATNFASWLPEVGWSLIKWEEGDYIRATPAESAAASILARDFSHR